MPRGGPEDAARRRRKGGKIEELRKETRKDGTVVYEAEIVKNGKGTDIEVSAEGKVLERGKTHDESSPSTARSSERSWKPAGETSGQTDSSG